MKNLVIRRYKNSDKKIVWKLHVDGLNQTGTFIFDSDSDSDFENIEDVYINNNGEFFVASFGKEIIGMGALKKVDNKIAEIKRIRVNVDYQQKGIGSAILKKLIEQAKMNGYKKLILDTSIKQISAHKLYKKNGFMEFKRDKRGDHGTIFYRIDLEQRGKNNT